MDTKIQFPTNAQFDFGFGFKPSFKLGLKPSLKPSFRSTAILEIAADSFLDIQFVVVRLLGN